MITGINLSETKDFIAKSDTENPTVWKLGVIPVRVFTKVSTITDQFEVITTMLRIGIKGWTNFDGIEFKTVKETILGKEMEVVPNELIERIPFKIMGEISNKLIEINNLTPDEIKN